jgi:hypothetical protein
LSRWYNRNAYWQYVEGIVTPEVDDRAGNGNCMKRFWTYIKHKRSDSNTIPPLKTDGILHPDSKHKANILSRWTNKSSFTNTGYFSGVVGFPEYDC